MLSPFGFAILSGAGLIHGTEANEINVHTTTRQIIGESEIDLTGALLNGENGTYNEKICPTAPIYVVITDEDGSVTGEIIPPTELKVDNTTGKKIIPKNEGSTFTSYKGKNAFIDYYIIRTEANTYEMQIDAERFAGNYYVEADTLFRRKSDGKDLPAILTFPNVKIQSNFTFSMASTGDPSTFTFTMDAFPGYTIFDKTKEVLCVMQIVDDSKSDKTGLSSVMTHDDKEVNYNEIVA